jgi:hypothetical protein
LGAPGLAPETWDITPLHSPPLPRPHR